MESSHAASFDGTTAGIPHPSAAAALCIELCLSIGENFSCHGLGRKDCGILGPEVLPAHAVFAGDWDRPVITGSI